MHTLHTLPPNAQRAIMDSLTPEERVMARRFAQVHASALSSLPVWLFSSGPLGDADHAIPPGEAADIPVLRRLTRAKDHRTFGGRLEMRHLNFAERATARTMHVPDGDSRDWDAIDRFAGEIAEEFLAAYSCVGRA